MDKTASVLFTEQGCQNEYLTADIQDQFNPALVNLKKNVNTPTIDDESWKTEPKHRYWQVSITYNFHDLKVAA